MTNALFRPHSYADRRFGGRAGLWLSHAASCAVADCRVSDAGRRRRALHAGFVADTALAEQLAEVGVILLMFGVGLQFHVEELLAVRTVAVPGAVAQSAVATVLADARARQPWLESGPAGIVFGIALSVASTVVLIRVLADNSAPYPRWTHRGRLACGRGPVHRACPGA